jgi:hypothetical protein
MGKVQKTSNSEDYCKDLAIKAVLSEEDTMKQQEVLGKIIRLFSSDTNTDCIENDASNKPLLLRERLHRVLTQRK